MVDDSRDSSTPASPSPEKKPQPTTAVAPPRVSSGSGSGGNELTERSGAAPASAKLAERLGKAVSSGQAILVLVILVICALFTWACPGTQAHSSDSALDRTTAATNRIVTSSQCTVGPYDEPIDVQAAVQAPEESATSCLSTFHRPADETLLAAFVIGHADKRELRPSLRSVYRDNFGLAYQRALLLKRRLDEARPGQQAMTVALPAAAAYVNGRVPPDQLARDRTVTISSLWSAPDPTSAPPPPIVEPISELDVLALLGLAIALAAYLAALRQNLDSMRLSVETTLLTGSPTSKDTLRKKVTDIKAVQRQLMVPDALLIVSALALGIYTVWWPEKKWLLQYGKSVFTAAALILVLYHLQQWIRHLGKR
jgi:hypothetical protein